MSRSPCGWTRPSSRAIASIAEDAWATTKYTDAIFDQTTGTWVSKAQAAGVPSTAFTSKEKSQDVAGSGMRRTTSRQGSQHRPGEPALNTDAVTRPSVDRGLALDP